MATTAKYNLVGIDGNAFSVMGYVSKAMRGEGFSREEIDEYQRQAKSGDYDNLLATSIEYVEKCNDRAAGVQPEDDEDECFEGKGDDEAGLFQPISFDECKDMEDTKCVVFTGVLFDYKDEELKAVSDFFHEVGLIPADKQVTNLRKITGNVLGDEGRTDVLVCFDECMPSPMARRRVGSDIKWVSDFVVNFAEDYGEEPEREEDFA